MTTIFNNQIVTWKAFFIVITCNFIFFYNGCTPSASEESEVVIIKDITVIDSVDGLRANQSVMIRGNRIAEVGMAEEIDEPAGATIIDGSGKYLIPGLWDAHVHLTNTDALRSSMFPLLIANGITYVRDTAAILDSIIPILEDAEESSANGMAPDIYFIGPHIDGAQLSWGSSVSAVSPEQAESIVDSLINAGVDELKVYELISPEVYSAVLSRATSAGYNVTAHVPLAMDVIEASNAGLTSMEHMKNLEFACSSDWETLLEERRQMIADGTDKDGNELRWGIHGAQRLHAIQTQDEERCRTVLNTLAENSTWQVPTLGYIVRADHELHASDDWRDTFKYLPESVQSDWEEIAEELTARSFSEADLARADWAYGMIPKLDEAGIGIMAGTDMPLFLLTPGFSLHKELELLVRAGLTPMQAIEAATLRPAQYYGLENQQGAIAEDMLADLVILDANPLEDIANTQQINAVMRNGHLHTRNDLDNILNQLEENGF